jgi:hypothetical protein
MARLFEAYFRSGEASRETLAGRSLPLDLSTDSASQYYFRAEFTRDRRWVVEAKLKHDFRKTVYRQVWNLLHGLS